MSSAVGEMNLLELREAYPALFYSPQNWFLGEAFTRALPDPYRKHGPPKGIVRVGKVPPLTPMLNLPSAVDLAHAFVTFPGDPIWQHFFWCSDLDSKGQRVYVGGVNPSNGHRFEIHRHLHVTAQFGEPSYR